MAFEGQTECAVRECGAPCADWANLCQDHFVPGMAFEYGRGIGMVTAWYAEHANEAGIILLKDFALGSRFGGASGFQANLEKQGFGRVRNLRTPDEFEVAKVRVARTPGKWSGPWLAEYSWESSLK